MAQFCAVKGVECFIRAGQSIFEFSFVLFSDEGYTEKSAAPNFGVSNSAELKIEPSNSRSAADKLSNTCCKPHNCAVGRSLRNARDSYLSFKYLSTPSAIDEASCLRNSSVASSFFSSPFDIKAVSTITPGTFELFKI